MKKLYDKGIGNTVSAIRRNNRISLSFCNKPLADIVRDAKKLDRCPRSVSFVVYETNRRNNDASTVTNTIDEDSQREDD